MKRAAVYRLHTTPESRSSITPTPLASQFIFSSHYTTPTPRKNHLLALSRKWFLHVHMRLCFLQSFSLLPTDKRIFPHDLIPILLHRYHEAAGTIPDKHDVVADCQHGSLPETKNNAVAALGIFPFYILIRASDPTASAFVTAFITDMHADFFPFVHFRRTEDGA